MEKPPDLHQSCKQGFWLEPDTVFFRSQMWYLYGGMISARGGGIPSHPITLISSLGHNLETVKNQEKN